MQRGLTYRFLDNSLVEITDPLTGDKQLKSLQEPRETEISAWAATRGIPILEIDPNTIDTSQYTGWYSYWTTVPLGNSSGKPLVIGDANYNEQTDVYGGYLDTLNTDYQTRLYEVDSMANIFLRHSYFPRPGISRQLANADDDSLEEVVFSLGGVVSGYEQLSRDSLPIHRTFEHNRYYHFSSPGSTGIYLGNLDDDTLTDFLYQGTGPNPNDTNLAISKTYVAEYDPAIQTFARVWSIQFYPGSGAAGFAVGDFDNDGKMEMVATHGSGKVYVAENSGDNQYTTTWQDSVPFVNFYYQGSGDGDNDGKIEFFTGATMSDGNWVMMYEADSNNAYSAKILFHLLSGGVFADPIYTAVDMDGDGKPELAMMVGSDLYVFKSNADNEYYLWYFRRENRMEAVAFYDFNRDGRMDFMSSKFAVNSQGRGRTYSDAYIASTIVSVAEQRLLPFEIQLLPNYPNPFNPQTSIEYMLGGRGRTTLNIYNILGQHAATLVDAEEVEGMHKITWNASGMASGVYICRLEVAGISISRKLLLIR